MQIRVVRVAMAQGGVFVRVLVPGVFGGRVVVGVVVMAVVVTMPVGVFERFVVVIVFVGLAL